MRRSAVEDTWRRLGKLKSNDFSCSLKKLEVKSCEPLTGISEITFSHGIFAICGLNGTGKSTILTCLKDTIGLSLNNIEVLNCEKYSLVLHMFNGQEYLNTEGKRLSDVADLEEGRVAAFIDYRNPKEAIDFFSKNANFDELLEGFEDTSYEEKNLGTINYLVGKEYSSCSFYEIEVDDGRIYPFFVVSIGNTSYNSLNMGDGEHFIMYMYWVINKLQNEKILILDEPETFLSITSQERIMTILANLSLKKRITVILATHSPTIIKRIPKSNICVVSKSNNITSISRPNNDQEALKILGMEVPCNGIIYFEDEVGQLFAEELLASFDESSVLSNYIKQQANGESEITKLLEHSIPEYFNYKIIGIYDGDVREKIESNEKICLPYLFLPIDVPIEKEIRDYAKEKLNLFCEKLQLKKDNVHLVFSQHEGIDYHDWLINISKELNKSKRDIIRSFIEMWMIVPSNKEKSQQFIEDLHTECLR